MLRVGLTGGIGSGKSTVARRLVERGAVLVDADAIAREVVAAGTEGLAAIVAAFGPQLVGPDGELDRPRMASLVFADEAARTRLNGIVHPLVRRRSAELLTAARPEAIVVQDVPLLVETHAAPSFALVVVVHADAEVRVRRLVGSRGMSETDARARIGAQASDADRHAAADVWLDNSGTPERLRAVVDDLWVARLVPFEENVRRHRPAPAGPPVLVEACERWAHDGARLAARVAHAAGERGLGVAHIGSTAVPGLPARDVVDLQLAVRSMADAQALAEALTEAGFPARPSGAGAEPGQEPVLRHAAADPARPARLDVRLHGSPGWRQALLLRDWLRADAAACRELAAAKRAAADAGGGALDPDRYAVAKAAWFDGASARAEKWAVESGWSADS